VVWQGENWGNGEKGAGDGPGNSYGRNGRNPAEKRADELEQGGSRGRNGMWLRNYSWQPGEGRIVFQDDREALGSANPGLGW
jgi:hypothetical protein